MKDIIIKGKGLVTVSNYIIFSIIAISFDLCYIVGILFNDECSLFSKCIFGTIMGVITFNIIISINWLNNIKITFKEDKIILNILVPKTRLNRGMAQYSRFLLSDRHSKYQVNLVPVTYEILYKNITKYGYIQDLKLKRAFFHRGDIVIVTKKHKYFLSNDQFSKKQISEILEVLDKRIKL